MPNHNLRFLVPFFSALLLAACGGGGSDSTDTKGSSFVLQLVTLRSDSLANTNSAKCQVYYQTGSSNSEGDATYYYATAVTDPAVALYNADGSLSSRLSVDSSGKVQVYNSDVPSGGYLAVTTTTTGQAFTEYNVTALSSSLLGAMTLSVASSNTSGSCVSGTYSEPASSTGYMNINVPGDFSAAPVIYRLDNGVDVTTTASNTKLTLTVYQDHPLLVTAYGHYDSDTGKASDMVGYAFISASALCSQSASCDGVDLVALDQTPAISFLNEDATDNAVLKVVSDSNIYNWQTLAASDTRFGYSDSLASANWYYRANGSYLNWDIARHSAISAPDAGVDVNLLGSLNLSDADPQTSASCSGAGFACVTLGGASASQFDYQRTLVSAYSSSGKVYMAMQVLGPAASQVNLPKVVDSSGNLLMSASDLAAGSVTVKLLSASESALFQDQRDDNLGGSDALYYGTVLESLAQQQSLASTLAASDSLRLSRSHSSL
ncbi:MAG: hypothetical protein VX447_06065 [Pseudomonadota bacterium]|uniref:hypothetical protein n=1 Tax=Gallaecimonas pentaromativorans TaxID=584787 RepID=UPI00067ECB54|nr:hypothetical protein [Gallaecimonas pentaromativorans]MED5524301.1 hypothetical protein [Pseudomonadota bacterium]